MLDFDAERAAYDPWRLKAKRKQPKGPAFAANAEMSELMRERWGDAPTAITRIAQDNTMTANEAEDVLEAGIEIVAQP